MHLIDNLLNKFTMYKVVLYGLLILSIVTFIYSITGILFYSLDRLVLSLAVLMTACFISNFIFARIFKVPVNPESSVITSLILFFVMVPISNVSEIWIYILAGVLAMGSKYLLAINKKHIFNPAAFGLVAIGLLGLPQISWWVGNSHLFPFVLIIGLLIVRKVRKFTMFTTYFLFGLISITVFAQINNKEIITTLEEAILSYPILFLGTIMLVEPLTTPPKRNSQLIYAVIVGLFSGAQYHLGPIYSSPELGLLIGNAYSYLVSFRKRLELTLIDKKELVPGIYEFIFNKSNFAFSPGQYMEWTLGGFSPDLRGVRRYFTIASSPTEENLKIALKINENGSTFKKKLVTLQKEERIFAGTLSGDFVLPKTGGKFVFIAGGIGITPFRSMVKNAIDKNQKIDAVLFYSCSTNGEFVYKDLFDSAKNIGLKTIYVCSNPTPNWKGIRGRIDTNLIKSEVPDYKDRTFYLSGPNAIVDTFKKSLRKMGIKPNKIISDYFSGY